MLKKVSPISESLTSSQLKIAVIIQEKEIARIERETIGWKWNARQKDMIHILGARALHSAEGKDIDPLMVSKFEDVFRKKMEVSRQCIQLDIKELQDANMIHKPYFNGNQKTKTIEMTDNGFSLWREYSNKRVALIYVVHEALNKLGGIPKTWDTTLSNWATSFFTDKAKAAAVALMCLSFAGISDEAKAEAKMTTTFSYTYDYYQLNTGTTEAWNWYDGPSNTVANVTTSLNNTQNPKAGFITDWAHENDYQKFTDPFAVADREGLYDELLPKDMTNLYQMNSQ